MCQKLKTNIIIIIIFPIYINVTFLLRVQYTIENYSIQSSEMPFSKEKISYIHTNYVVDICVRMALAQLQTTSQTRRLFCVCKGILKCRAREFYGEKPIKSMTDILYYIIIIIERVRTSVFAEDQKNVVTQNTKCNNFSRDFLCWYTTEMSDLKVFILIVSL